MCGLAHKGQQPRGKARYAGRAPSPRPPDLTLASGSTHGFHSDFVNAWDQEHLTEKVELCLHRDAVCGLSSNRSEDPLFSG